MILAWRYKMILQIPSRSPKDFLPTKREQWDNGCHGTILFSLFVIDLPILEINRQNIVTTQ